VCICRYIYVVCIQKSKRRKPESCIYKRIVEKGDQGERTAPATQQGTQGIRKAARCQQVNRAAGAWSVAANTWPGQQATNTWPLLCEPASGSLVRSGERVDGVAARLGTWQLLWGQLVKRAHYTKP